MGFEPLFSWLPELLAWLISWLPHGARLLVREGAVKISGMKVREVKHGGLFQSWYFWVPRFTEVFTDNVKRKVVELPEQLLTTRDGKRVRASPGREISGANLELNRSGDPARSAKLSGHPVGAGQQRAVDRLGPG